MSHYEALGIDPAATQEEIKAAFRKLAQRWHPDREGGHEDEFRKIQAAYEVLSDEEKRAKYNRGELDFRSPQEIIEREAQGSILQHFQKIVDALTLESVAYCDFRTALQNSVKDAERAFEQEFSNNKRMLKRLKAIKKRIRGGEFIFLGHIEQQQLALLKKQKQGLFVKKVIERMKEMAETFDFDFEARQEPIFVVQWINPIGTTF